MMMMMRRRMMMKKRMMMMMKKRMMMMRRMMTLMRMSPFFEILSIKITDGELLGGIACDINDILQIKNIIKW
jgi:hypothetical protein